MSAESAADGWEGEGPAAPIHQTPPPAVMAAVLTAIMAAGSQLEVLHCRPLLVALFSVVETSALL